MLSNIPVQNYDRQAMKRTFGHAKMRSKSGQGTLKKYIKWSTPYRRILKTIR